MKLRNALLAAGMSLSLAASAHAISVPSGEPAPQWQGTDTKGVVHRLSDYAGQTVILEWTNHECPYVRKHYETQNMQALQADAAAQGIVWLSVISSAPGKQGHVSGEEADRLTESRGAQPAAVILDPSGDIGRAYDAKTTPHMYIITPDQVLAYQGAIDDKPTANHASVETAKNYVRQALAELAANVPVSEPETTPYGCSVKY